MNRVIMWTPALWPGCEHVHVRTTEAGVIANGMIVAAEDGVPVRLNYQITCDDAWRTRELWLSLYGREPVTLRREADGRWYHGETELAELAGCVDVDIALTPFTNTLPIRRLGLEAGASASARMVYVQPGSDLDISTSDQHYTRLPGDPADRYRYQSGDFSANLMVDGDGIVIDYPGLWTRTR